MDFEKYIPYIIAVASTVIAYFTNQNKKIDEQRIIEKSRLIKEIKALKLELAEKEELIEKLRVYLSKNGLNPYPFKKH